MTECLKSIPVSLILWCGCWWAKQSTAFILQDSSRDNMGTHFCTTFDVNFYSLWHLRPSCIHIMHGCMMWWCVCFYALCSYRSTFSLWSREIWEGKGQIRVVKRAGGRILGGERHISSVGKLLHQTQTLTSAHVEQNMFVSHVKEINLNIHHL